MFQNIMATVVFIGALALSYLGWQWTEGGLNGAVMGFILVAAPGFYYVYVEWPQQQARKKALRQDDEQ